MEVLRVSPRSPRALKTAVDVLSHFLNEGVFNFTQKGVWLEAFDVTRIVYVSLDLPRGFFRLYELESPEVKVPLSIYDLDRALSLLSSDDVLTMTLSGTNFWVRMEGEVTKEFALPVLDVNEPPGPVTYPSFTAKVSLPVSKLKQGLKGASIISRNILLRVEEGKFYIEAREGNSFSRSVVGRGADVKIEASTITYAHYSLDYLLPILKGADGLVNLEFVTDGPLKVSYSIEGGDITFLLAPLIL